MMNIIEVMHREWTGIAGQPQAFTPRDTLDEETRVLRLRLHREEFDELDVAVDMEGVNQIGKEALDLIWVGLGTLITIGWDLNTAFAALYASNMSKFVDRQAIKDAGGKVQKGPNYKVPDFTALLTHIPGS